MSIFNPGSKPMNEQLPHSGSELFWLGVRIRNDIVDIAYRGVKQNQLMNGTEQPMGAVMNEAFASTWARKSLENKPEGEYIPTQAALVAAIQEPLVEVTPEVVSETVATERVLDKDEIRARIEQIRNDAQNTEDVSRDNWELAA